MKIEKQILRFTKISLSTLIVDVEYFILNEYPDIVSFYKGESRKPITSTLSRLDLLIDRVDTLIVQLEKRKRNFTDIRIWDVYDYLHNVLRSLESCKNTAKWVKANFSGEYDAFLTEKYGMEKNQTIEQVAEKYGYPQSATSWIELAQRNSTREEDYTNEGNYSLKIRLDTRQTSDLNSIVSIIKKPEDIWGVDLPRSFHFDSETNDIAVLDNTSTLYQTVETLSLLRQGDKPSRPTDGVSRNILGGNRSSVKYPLITRQISNVFGTDDSFQSISVDAAYVLEEALYIDLGITTVDNKKVNQSVPI